MSSMYVMGTAYHTIKEYHDYSVLSLALAHIHRKIWSRGQNNPG